jgi:two-component system chemotaxis response regulator CheV
MPSPFSRDIVIVTEFSNSITGFLVSGVTEIHRVGWGQVIPPAGYIAHSTDAIVGMVDKGDRFIQLLDLETILSEFQLHPDEIESVVAQQQYTALVADDSATIRTMLQASLEQANFNHIITSNGEEALRQIMALKQRAEDEKKDISNYVDVVISDIEMPLMDGFSLTKNIKEDPVLQKLPVILYSSIITDELRHKGETVKADFQVSKPDLSTIAKKAIELIENGNS